VKWVQLDEMTKMGRITLPNGEDLLDKVGLGLRHRPVWGTF
jgi:hypothetical protein